MPLLGRFALTTGAAVCVCASVRCSGCQVLVENGNIGIHGIIDRCHKFCSVQSTASHTCIVDHDSWYCRSVIVLCDGDGDVHHVWYMQYDVALQ